MDGDNNVEVLTAVLYMQRQNLKQQFDALRAGRFRLVGLRLRFPRVEDRETGRDAEVSWAWVQRHIDNPMWEVRL